MNIYVGNLPYSTTPDDLREVFAAFGEVSAARIVNDRAMMKKPAKRSKPSTATISAAAKLSSTRHAPVNPVNSEKNASDFLREQKKELPSG